MDGSFQLYRQTSTARDQELWTAERGLWLLGDEAMRALVDPECVLASPDPWGALSNDADAAVSGEQDVWSEVSLTEQEFARPRDGVAALAYRARGLRDGAVCEALCRSTYVERNGGWRLVQHQRDVVWRATTAA